LLLIIFTQRSFFPSQSGLRQERSAIRVLPKGPRQSSPKRSRPPKAKGKGTLTHRSKGVRIERENRPSGGQYCKRIHRLSTRRTSSRHHPQRWNQKDERARTGHGAGVCAHRHGRGSGRSTPGTGTSYPSAFAEEANWRLASSGASSRRRNNISRMGQPGATRILTAVS
jgi:hypothetical protein